MADNIVNLQISGRVDAPAYVVDATIYPAQNYTYSGNISVDYTSLTATPELTVSNGSNFISTYTGAQPGSVSAFVSTGPGEAYSAFFILPTGGGPTSTANDRFYLSWYGEVPTEANVSLRAQGSPSVGTGIPDPVTATPVCFVSGTLIATARGDVPVEELAIGDLAVTASGGRRRITWIGNRTLVGASGALSVEVRPVRILAGAFGGGLPARDLFLSPGHPVLVGDHLVPIMCLINGTSIARMPVESVTYWHVELDRHDILLAEGLPAESFLDFGIRDWFENGADHALADPDFIPAGLNGRCRPVVTEGVIVETERRRIDLQFAIDLAAHCAWPAQDASFAA